MEYKFSIIITFTRVVLYMEAKQSDDHHLKRFSYFSQKLSNNHFFKMYIGRIFILTSLLLSNIQQIAIMVTFICPLYLAFIVFVCILNIPFVYTFLELQRISQQELLTYQTKQNEIVEKVIGKIFKLQSPHVESIDISNNTLIQESKDFQIFCQHCSKNQQKYLFHCKLLNICLNIKKKKKYFLFFVFLFVFKIFAITVNFIVLFQKQEKNQFLQIIVILSLVLNFLQVFFLVGYLNNKNFKKQKKSTQNSENFFQKNTNIFNNQVFPIPINTKQNQNSQLEKDDQNQNHHKSQIQFKLNIRKRSKTIKYEKQQKDGQTNSYLKKPMPFIGQSEQKQKAQKRQFNWIETNENSLKNMLKFKTRPKLNSSKHTIDETKNQYMRRRNIFQNSQVHTPKAFFA